MIKVKESNNYGLATKQIDSGNLQLLSVKVVKIFSSCLFFLNVDQNRSNTNISYTVHSVCTLTTLRLFLCLVS